MIGNENVDKKQTGKTDVHVNGHSLKKVAQNSIAAIRNF